MGTWSHEPFGNDTANDWAYELEETTDLSLIESTLDKVIAQADQYLDASEGEEAVAAIEVLAKLIGHGSQSDSYTAKVDIWVASLTEKPSAELLQKAQRAIEKILAEDSELHALWRESTGFASWTASMAHLTKVVSVQN
jgi:hypothetical protein